MGFIRESEGVDFVIAPSLTTKEDVSFVSSYIEQHKKQAKASHKTLAKTFLSRSNYSQQYLVR